MKLRIAPARAGSAWVRAGLKTFFGQPLAFISLFFFSTTIISIASLLPFIGSAIALMLAPMVTLALMAATAHAAATPDKPAIGSTFITALLAVRASARPLAILGALYAGAFLAMMAISALIDGGELARMFLLGEPPTREVMQSPGFQAALWITMALYLSLSLAFWHAPALVHWHRVPPLKSVFFSFVACIRNIGALTVFGIVWFGIFIAGIIVLSLVVGLLVSVGAGGGEGGAIGTLLTSGALVVLGSMFFSSLWFTFRDSFDAD